MTTNRSFENYSPAAIVRQRIEREVSNAQTVYAQAITDREAAIARELEATPAVVIVDPIPTRLLPESRHVIVKLMLAGILGVIAVAAAMFLMGDFGSGDAQDPAVIRSVSPQRSQRPAEV
jgi:uncharacterized protein involved in exopolysaccharide biosynthesis